MSKNDRSQSISRLISSADSRFAYIWSTVSVLVASQIKALRLKSTTPTQRDFAAATGMHQSLISRLETPGTNATLETLARVAAANGVALTVEFVPFSRMRQWENGYSQDAFVVKTLAQDVEFTEPNSAATCLTTADLKQNPYLPNFDMLVACQVDALVPSRAATAPFSYQPRRQPQPASNTSSGIRWNLQNLKVETYTHA